MHCTFLLFFFFSGTGDGDYRRLLKWNPGPKFWNQNSTRMATMVSAIRHPVKSRSGREEASITRYFWPVRAITVRWTDSRSWSARSSLKIFLLNVYMFSIKISISCCNNAAAPFTTAPQ